MHISDQQLSAIHWRASSLYERHGKALLSKEILNQLTIHQLWEWDNALSDAGGSRLSARLALIKGQRKQILQVSEAFRQEQLNRSGWISRFRDILQGYAKTRIPYRSGNRRPVPFESLLLPFTEYAAQTLQRTYSAPSVVSAHVIEHHLQYLLQRLSRTSSGCFYEVFDTYRRGQTRSPKDNSDRLYRKFVRRLYQGEIVTFFEEYSALARLLTTIVDQWLTGTILFLQRLEEDLNAIRQHFFDRTDPGHLMEIHTGVTAKHTAEGDVHILSFESGAKLVYKPRSAATDVALQGIISWLNENCPDALPLHAVEVLDRSDYSWHAYVPYKACKTNADVREYYVRIGQLIALLQVLGGTDYHFGNVIARGADPVLIDNETLFSPIVRVSPDAAFSGDKYLEDGMQYALSRSHFLLDTRQLIYRAAPSISAVFEEKDRIPVVTYTHANTDDIKQRGSHVAWIGRHIPKLNRKKADPRAYLNEIERGYTRYLSLITAHKHAFGKIVKTASANFNTDVRLLVRATRYYEQLASRSLKTMPLRDGISRSLLFEELARFYFNSEATHETSELLWREVDMLQHQLIPWFHIRAKAGQYVDGSHKPRSKSVVRSSAKRVFEQQMARLNPPYVSLQTALIRHYCKPVKKLAGTLSRRDMLACITMPGENLHLLYKHLYPIEDLIREAHSGKSGALRRYRLSDGLGGILLSLAALQTTNKGKDYRETIEFLTEPLRLSLASDTSQRRFQGIGYGALNGVGSVVYMLSTLAQLLGDKKYLDGAIQLVHNTSFSKARVTGDLSLANGIGGYLLCLIKCEQMSQRKALSPIIRQYSEAFLHALRNRKNIPENPGYTEGLGGVLFVLCKLYVRQPDTFVRQQILDLYPRLKEHWEEVSSHVPLSPDVDSLHDGLAGWYITQRTVALLQGLQIDDAPVAYDAILLQINERVPDQIRTGFAGRIEPLLLNRVDTPLPLKQFARQWIGRYMNEQRHILTPHYLVPTFYDGTAGILYQQLRLLNPGNIPSVMTFS